MDYVNYLWKLNVEELNNSFYCNILMVGVHTNKDDFTIHISNKLISLQVKEEKLLI